MVIEQSLAKLEIPLTIIRALNKGEIARVYEKIYRLADQLSAKETRRYMAKKPLEYLEHKIRQQEERSEVQESWALRTTRQISQYRNRRLKYHIDNMLKLLELHITSKDKGGGAAR